MDQWYELVSSNTEFTQKLFSLYYDNIDDRRINYKIDPLFFIATHSSHIIPHLNLHEESNKLAIYRLYKKENNIEIGQLQEAHLELKQFLIYDRSVLEGLFAKKIILVEGDTEAGFLPIILQNNNINIHEKNILIIKSPPGNFDNIIKILTDYGIETYVLTDRDKNHNSSDDSCSRVKKLKADGVSNNLVHIYVSDLWDFEESMLAKILNKPSWYNTLKLFRGDMINVAINSHSPDLDFQKKLIFFRENKKTIQDGYKLAQEILDNTCDLPDYINNLIRALND